MSTTNPNTLTRAKTLVTACLLLSPSSMVEVSAFSAGTTSRRVGHHNAAQINHGRPFLGSTKSTRTGPTSSKSSRHGQTSKAKALLLHMSSASTNEPPQGYAGSGQTSLAQAAVVVSPEWDPSATTTSGKRPLAKIRSWVTNFARDLAPAATSEKVPSYKKLLMFAVTMGMVLIAEPLLSLVDTSVVAWSQGSTGVTQLAAMGPATTLMDLAIYMCYFLALGTNNLLSEGISERRWRDVQKTTSNILAVAGLVGLSLAGFLWFASPSLLNSMAGASASPELLKYAISYTRIRALVAPAALMGLVAQAFCMANHHTTPPMLAVLLASVINISGDLIFAKHGVTGAAWATAVATIGATTLLLTAVKRRLREWRQKEVDEWNSITPSGKPMEEAAPETLMASTTVDLEDAASSMPESLEAITSPKAPEDVTADTADVQVTSTVVALQDHEATQVEFETVTAATATPTPAKEEEQVVASPPVPKRVPFLSLPDRKSLVQLASVSGPLCFNMWAKMGCYSALTLAATHYGATSLAAHTVLMKLFFFFGCFADSLGMSAQSFLPRTLYPLDKRAYRATLRRLMVLAGAAALFLGKATTSVLSSAGGFLARDGVMLQVMNDHGPLLALSLFLHPLVVLTEGTVIATRDFWNLIATYCTAVAAHAFLLTSATSFTAVWQALVGFQVVRMASYRLFRKRGNTPESAAPVAA